MAQDILTPDFDFESHGRSLGQDGVRPGAQTEYRERATITLFSPGDRPWIGARKHVVEITIITDGPRLRPGIRVDLIEEMSRRTLLWESPDILVSTRDFVGGYAREEHFDVDRQRALSAAASILAQRWSGS